MIEKETYPSGWKIAKFEECIEKSISSNKLKIPKKDYEKFGDYPIIDQGADFIAGYTNELNKIYNGSLPIVIFGDHTRIFKFVDFPFALGADGTKILIPKRDLLNAKYFYFFLKGIKIEDHGYDRHYKYLKEKKIVIPPLKTQQKIVEILEKAEKLKEWRVGADVRTDEYIPSLFQEMFLDKNFETDYLKKYTKLISSGSTPLGGSENYLNEGDILFIRSQNVLMNKFSGHDHVYISQEIHEKMKRTWVKKSDVLLNITGASIGRTVVYTGENNKANVNQHVCIIRLNDFKKINPIYLNYYLSSNKMQAHIMKINAGATRQALNFTQIGKFKVPIPPIALQNQFAETVQKVEQLKHHQKQSKQEIDNLFNTLMQKAFKGELTC